ncbi:hypothetical protein H6G27_15610 [Nostoc linckia FACHB-104]|nr:hypothetical protein [Nostoc linckia FACHB-104]
MTNQAKKQFITELANNVVMEMAPQERRVFHSISEAYFQNPEKTLKGEEGGDELIGFGVGEVALLTPIILEVAAAVFRFVSDISQKALEDALKDSIKEESSNFFKKLIKFIKQRLKVDDPPPEVLSLSSLTQEQLVQVRQIAFEKALLLNLDNDQASLLADSLVGSLQLTISYRRGDFDEKH